MKVEWFVAENHGDARGKLVSLEEGKQLPFPIRRVYYIYDTLPGVRRGFHAHKKLKQLLMCVNGSCKILLDDGVQKEIVNLDKPYKGIFIESNIWREMYDFSQGAVLMVLASELYDETDYIRDYGDFLRYVRGQKG